MEDTKKTQTKKPLQKWNRPVITGSDQAKRQAAVILEVVSGTRGAQEGSEVLGISSMRYYQLEERALQGMVTALEPRAKGPRVPSPEETLRRVEKERERMKREVGRLQTLLRMVRKSVHLQEPRSVRGVGTTMSGKKAKKPLRRVEKLLERLRPTAEPLAAAEAAV
jgi:hypothetical protein